MAIAVRKIAVTNIVRAPYRSSAMPATGEPIAITVSITEPPVEMNVRSQANSFSHSGIRRPSAERALITRVRTVKRTATTSHPYGFSRIVLRSMETGCGKSGTPESIAIGLPGEPDAPIRGERDSLGSSRALEAARAPHRPQRRRHHPRRVGCRAVRPPPREPVSGCSATSSRGMLIGPFGIGLVTDVDSIHVFAEFGVVFLLFTIGLELPWERIKVLSPALFGLGVAQILITGAAIAGIAVALGVAPDAAIVIGNGACPVRRRFSVIQILLDRRQLATRFGRAAFTVLMMQDLAIAPILVLTLALTNREGGLVRVPRVCGSGSGCRAGDDRGVGPVSCCGRYSPSWPPSGATRFSRRRRCWWWSA